MEINISKLSSTQLCVFKRLFLAHTNGVSEIALKVPNHVVTCENKDKRFFFFLWPGVMERIKERLYGGPVIQCSLASCKGSWDFNKRIHFFHCKKGLDWLLHL